LALLASASRTSSAPTIISFQPFGNAKRIFTEKAPELLLSGPAGTGKSLACLYKLHALALKYPGMRGAIIRRTRTSLTQSALVTFDKKVQPQRWGTRFHHQDQEYRYPNGSVIIVGGLVPDITKVMSTEYDAVYVQEATELEEGECEALTTRLRNGVMPYQQLLMDCNPDAPQHWLKRRSDAGGTLMLESRHEDNPTLWDHIRGVWTEFGKRYIAVLDALTGVRFLRLRKGIWAAAEGMVYEGWDRNVHLIDRMAFPLNLPRFWVVDFGYTNPFVWQQWVQDHDGRLYRTHEIYRTQRLVEDHAKDILAATRNEPRPSAIICDHDAEDRATLARHLGMDTIGAWKSVSDGIQAVASRLKVAGDGRPRLFLMRDSLVSRDDRLDDLKKPGCTEEEVEGYVWDVASGQKKGEAPVKKDDHGMDCMRYLVAHVDELRSGPGASYQFDAYGRVIA
jgi:DNA polymerase III delta prime subunit